MIHRDVARKAEGDVGLAIIPPTMTNRRQHLIAHLRQEEASEDTEQLIDWLTDAWATLDLLIERFGEARAWQLYTAQAERVQGAPNANVT